MLVHLLCMQDLEVRTRNLLTAERLAKVSAPTKIFWGRHNPMGDVTEAQTLHSWIPGSQLEIFEHCGHFPQLEYPQRYNQLSVDFLREHSGAAR
jgi:2-hydroxy-6-oxonona-2,4-dienedioate hydrolase